MRGERNRRNRGEFSIDGEGLKIDEEYWFLLLDECFFRDGEECDERKLRERIRWIIENAPKIIEIINNKIEELRRDPAPLPQLPKPRRKKRRKHHSG